jgi:hypothetical protein
LFEFNRNSTLTRPPKTSLGGGKTLPVSETICCWTVMPNSWQCLSLEKFALCI